MQVTRGSLGRRRDERGAVAIIVAVSLTMLLVASALVLDFGLIRFDRQSARSAADNASQAGMVAADGGTGEIYSFRGVCGALESLRSKSEFSGLPLTFCNSTELATNSTKVCLPGNPVRYEGTTTSGGKDFRVVITNPYDPAGGNWHDETYASVGGDVSTLDNCDQIGVEIYEARSPGLGSLATDKDLTFGIRAVTRAILTEESQISPALLILERENCLALRVSSSGGGSLAAIKALGHMETPGSIHVDSAATGGNCSTSNGQVIVGSKTEGIVSYGSVAPPGVSGIISSYAAYLEKPAALISDGLDRVHATTTTTAPSMDQLPILARAQITRAPVDRRYRLPVRAAIASASGLWGAAPPDATWTRTGCTPDLNTAKLWIDCPGGLTLRGDVVKATDIYLNGYIKGGIASFPNAQRFYINPTGRDAISLSNNTAFAVRGGETTPCSWIPTSGRARLFVRGGNISANGGTLRLCNTTVFMLGGDQATGCVPTTDGRAPTNGPCPGNATGTSGINVQGASGVIDWTSPNEFGAGVPDSEKGRAYGDFEDLALWAEMALEYSFSGNGALNTVGVYMIPNGHMKVAGGGAQTLFNAQYVARTFEATGNGAVAISTDPKNAISVPMIKDYILIR